MLNICQTDDDMNPYLAMIGSSQSQRGDFMTDKNHWSRRCRRSRRKTAPLFLAGTILLLGIALGTSLPPASQTGTNQSDDTSEIHTMEFHEALSTDDWKLLLVNDQNPLPENYSIQTVELRNGFQVDERCYPDLQAMMDACREEGLSPVICSAYRTQEYQEKLYQIQIDKQLALGYSQEHAAMEAGKQVAVPGTSEHQLGLAVDIVDMSYQLLDNAQADTAVQKWLMEHSWEYGFILRYSDGKSEITGFTYEPWHYRYVGRENAEQIYHMGVCLEEYLDRL